jgi:hypothetical protein
MNHQLNEAIKISKKFTRKLFYKLSHPSNTIIFIKGIPPVIVFEGNMIVFEGCDNL